MNKMNKLEKIIAQNDSEPRTINKTNITQNTYNIIINNFGQESTNHISNSQLASDRGLGGLLAGAAQWKGSSTQAYPRRATSPQLR